MFNGNVNNINGNEWKNLTVRICAIPTRNPHSLNIGIFWFEFLSFLLLLLLSFFVVERRVTNKWPASIFE